MESEKKLNILMIGAHPDDCEIKAGGTIKLFADLGHNVRMISVTNGNAGHHQMKVKRTGPDYYSLCQFSYLKKFLYVPDSDSICVHWSWIRPK